MARKLSVTVVGPGSLGGALAVALHAAGYRVREVVYRSDSRRAQAIARRAGAEAVSFRQATFPGEVVWICVGDAAIAETAGLMSNRGEWKGKYVFHASGALSSNELKSLKRKGASVASMHPMMSFVRSAEASFEHVPFALEGAASAKAVAVEIAKALGGMSFELKKKDKPLYHALGAFSSPLLVAHLATAERIGKRLGLKPEQTRKIIAPILQKTLLNYLQHGGAAAFSGPMMRGDVQTVRRNLEALKRTPGADEVYRALAKMAVRALPVRQKSEIVKLLSD
jgi:predicted short-subunit dehydrogenase-like oxidoreductase (DUF2520 family)